MVREEIAASTARLIANPVAHKLKAAGDRRRRGADPWPAELHAPPAPRSSRRTVRRGVRRRRVGRRRRRGRSSPPCAPAATRRCSSTRSASAAAAAAAGRARTSSTRRWPALDAGRARRPRGRDRERAARSRRPGWTPRREVALPAGPHRSACARCRSRRAAIYVPAGRNPYPSTVVMGAVTARAAGVDEVVVRARGDAPRDPRRLRAVRGRRGLPDGRRAGRRRARLRHRDGAAPPT